MTTDLSSDGVPISEVSGTARRVVMLIYPGVIGLDVAGPLEAFRWANMISERPLYEITTVAQTVAPVPTCAGFSILPMSALAAAPLQIDTLLVAGGGGPDRVTDPELITWLQRTAPSTRRVGSIFTGVFALADAGLLDGKQPVTDWRLCADLVRRQPAVDVEVDPIFVQDCNIYASADVTTGIDLALTLIEEDHGSELARAVARHLMPFQWCTGGGAQFSALTRTESSIGSSMRDLQLWCRENIGLDLSVRVLAERMQMSERNFARRFVERTGHKPGAFVLAERMVEARRLLEQTDLSLKDVTRRCGLGSIASLRRNFTQWMGVAPSDYRERFRAGSSSNRLSLVLHPSDRSLRQALDSGPRCDPHGSKADLQADDRGARLLTGHEP